MLIVLYYCLKVIICSGLLYGYYLLALRNNHFHQWNRYYLLAILIFSFTLPLLKIPVPFFQEDEQPVMESFRIIAAPDIYFSRVQPQEYELNWQMMAGVLYGCVVLFFIFLLIRNIFRVLILKKRYPKESLNGIHFYNTNEPATPFSFFKNIFWNSAISLDNEKGRQMLRHELTHIQQRHSLDKVVVEVLIAFAWWNPFLYYIRKELSVIHEFTADQKASAGDDKLQYASLLLMKAIGSNQFALGNPFFHSQLKRRLMMLTSNKHPRFSYLRRLMVLPLAAISLLLFSFKYKEIKDKQKTAAQNNTVAKDEDDFYDDTTNAKFYVQLNRTYKGSAIESIMPTTNMSGAVVKTIDDKTYFLDRAAAAKELSFIITDSSFTAPPGAILVTGTRKVVAINGVVIQVSPNTNPSHYPYKIDTTTVGVANALGKYSIQGDEITIEQNEDMHVIDGSMQMSVDGAKDWNKALIIVDGVKLNITSLIDLNSINFKSMDVLKGENAVAQYGEEGKNGVIIITTKTSKSLSGNPLYVLDEVESTKEIVDHILPENIKAVDILKGEAAVKAYGEKGKNGVIKITTKLAKNEVTFPETNQDNKLSEKVVIGRRLVKDSSGAKSGVEATPVAQPENLKEVVVVGYQTKTDYNPVFTKVDNPASFPGGIDGWRRYLERQLQYPKAAQEKGTQGTIRVQMTVAENGDISELKALNDPGNGLAEEAVRVIAKGPKWIPATHKGKPVSYRFVQTLTFQLQ